MSLSYNLVLAVTLYNVCSVHRGMLSTSGFSIEIERLLATCSPTCIMISPDVLNIPRCTHGIPHCIMISPDVLNIPWCTHDIPPMYSWYPPDVLNTPRCTKHPPMYWTHIIQGGYSNMLSIWKFSFFKLIKLTFSRTLLNNKPILSTSTYVEIWKMDEKLQFHIDPQSH